MEELQAKIATLNRFKAEWGRQAKQIYNRNFEVINFDAQHNCKRLEVLQKRQKERIIKHIEDKL